MERSWKTDEVGRDYYEEQLIASVRRKHALQHLDDHRILKVTDERKKRNRLLGVLRDARQACQDYRELIEDIDDFLAYQAERDTL